MTVKDTGRGDPVRVAVIGAGWQGRVWARMLAGRDDTDVVAIADINLARAEAVAASLGSSVGAVTSIEDLNPLGIDVAINATVPSAHARTSWQALERGLHLLVEKPLTTSVREAQRLARRAIENGVYLMAAQTRTLATRSRVVKCLIPRVGQLRRVSAEFRQRSPLGGFRREIGHPLLIDVAVHSFDMARYFVGGDARSVVCTERPPTQAFSKGGSGCHASFSMENGCAFEYVGDWESTGEPTPWDGAWMFEGSDGTLHWTGRELFLEAGDGSGPQRLSEEAIDLPGNPDELEVYRQFRLGILGIRSEDWGSGGQNLGTVAMVEGALRSVESANRAVCMVPPL